MQTAHPSIIIALTDGDRIALSMLIMMSIALAVVGMLALLIYRNGKKPRTEEDDLMDSVSSFTQQPQRKSAQKKDRDNGNTPMDWEKNADWWRE